jgi:hypothetical protein
MLLLLEDTDVSEDEEVKVELELDVDVDADEEVKAVLFELEVTLFVVEAIPVNPAADDVDGELIDVLDVAIPLLIVEFGVLLGFFIIS